MGSLYKVLRPILLQNIKHSRTIYNGQSYRAVMVKYPLYKHYQFSAQVLGTGKPNAVCSTIHLLRFASSQQPINTTLRSRVPEEFWVLIIAGIVGLLVFAFTVFKRKEISKKRGTDIEMKLAKAKECLQNDKKEEAFLLLQDVLSLIHEEIEEKQPEKSEKGKRPFHKALKYTLDQSSNLAIDLELWEEAEHYLRLMLQEVLSSGTPKNDDSVIELSLKLSQACEKQRKYQLAAEGYQWCVDTAADNIDQADEVNDNSKALLGLSLDALGMFQLSRGQTEKAIENLESALEIAKEVLGKKDEQTLVLMNNLAKAFAEAQQYSKAEALVLKTIELAKEVNSDFRAVFMANLGSILLERGNVVRAKKAFVKAFKLADDTHDEVTKTMIRDSLMVLDINVGHG